MSGFPNLSSNALQWARLRLRPRKPQTTAGDGRLQGPALQERRSLDPAKPQNPDSAFEVNSGLHVGGPTLKLANPGTGGKVFGLQYAIPIGGAFGYIQALAGLAFDTLNGLNLQVTLLRSSTRLQSSTQSVTFGPPLISKPLSSGREVWTSLNSTSCHCRFRKR